MTGMSKDSMHDFIKELSEEEIFNVVDFLAKAPGRIANLEHVVVTLMHSIAHISQGVPGKEEHNTKMRSLVAEFVKAEITLGASFSEVPTFVSAVDISNENEKLN